MNHNCPQQISFKMLLKSCMTSKTIIPKTCFTGYCCCRQSFISVSACKDTPVQSCAQKPLMVNTPLQQKAPIYSLANTTPNGNDLSIYLWIGVTYSQIYKKAPHLYHPVLVPGSEQKHPTCVTYSCSGICKKSPPPLVLSYSCSQVCKQRTTLVSHPGSARKSPHWCHPIHRPPYTYSRRAYFADTTLFCDGPNLSDVTERIAEFGPTGLKNRAFWGWQEILRG